MKPLSCAVSKFSQKLTHIKSLKDLANFLVFLSNFIVILYIIFDECGLRFIIFILAGTVVDTIIDCYVNFEFRSWDVCFVLDVSNYLVDS